MLYNHNKQLNVIIYVDTRKLKMKLKSHSIGPRIEDEIEKSQYWRENATSHGPKEWSRLRRRRYESWYSVVF